jgi:hypothetical protein
VGAMPASFFSHPSAECRTFSEAASVGIAIRYKEPGFSNYHVEESHQPTKNIHILI